MSVWGWKDLGFLALDKRYSWNLVRPSWNVAVKDGLVDKSSQECVKEDRVRSKDGGKLAYHAGPPQRTGNLSVR